MKYRILVAEDEIDISNILKIYLESNGYEVTVANDGETAYHNLSNNQFDLAILDIMMPKMDGFTLIQKIRAKMNIPLIVLTARIEDNDKILGLNLGADDYMTKPFNPLEIVARVNAHLRRCHQLNDQNNAKEESKILKIGSLMVDTEKYCVSKNNQEITLTPTEYKLLVVLMKNANRVYTKAQLCELIYGDYFEGYENSVTVHIANLRDKIETDSRNPEFIKNLRGVGYKFEKK